MKTPCKEFQGARDEDGYGRLHAGKRAHRVALEQHLGRALIGDALHTCDNRACINVQHLYEGSHDENMRDRQNRDRQARGESHGCARLTEVQVREIRSRYARGEMQKTIAAQFGIPQQHVSLIVRRKSWSHVA